MAPVPHNIVVIGGSAGAIDPLLELASGLPAYFPAPVCIVVHLPAWHRSDLAMALTRAGKLPAQQPLHMQTLEPAQIYVAPPDHHLIMDDGRAYIWRGPKENQHRPAVNALFRSAAVAYDSRVISIILSDTLEDGATKL